jgi:2-C-methyl-D-erythritol 2,4-cyclodiphosphate synthase
MNLRIGHGYDVHRLKEGRPCILCGVNIPFEYGPDGHSDADVPVHALMDGLLGALALGDIGKLFPDTDTAYENADSMTLLKDVYSRVLAMGYSLSNADITIIAQRPRISPHIDRMRQNTALVLGVELSRISIKATTEEGLGFTGEGKGIASHAVVLLEKL